VKKATSKAKNRKAPAKANPNLKRVARGKKTANSRANKLAATPKAKAAATPRSQPKETAKKQSAAPKKRKSVALEAPAASEAPAATSEAPAAHTSERAAQLPPHERPLTDEERDAMGKVALTALGALASDGAPGHVVSEIAAYVNDVRSGRKPEPSGQDIQLGLGVLWGEQVRAQVRWLWVHLSYANGFASYALVPHDRAFACFPLNRVTELMRLGADGANTSVALFDSIRLGTLPPRHERAYLVIG